LPDLELVLLVRVRVRVELVRLVYEQRGSQQKGHSVW